MEILTNGIMVLVVIFRKSMVEPMKLKTKKKKREEKWDILQVIFEKKPSIIQNFLEKLADKLTEGIQNAWRSS